MNNVLNTTIEILFITKSIYTHFIFYFLSPLSLSFDSHQDQIILIDGLSFSLSVYITQLTYRLRLFFVKDWFCVERERERERERENKK